MFRKKGSLILFGTFLLITWNAILLFLLWSRPTPSQLDEQQEAAAKPTSNVMGDVLEMADSIAAELKTQKEILLQIQSRQSLWRPPNASTPAGADVAPTQPIIPILVIACNRVTVRRCLDKLLEHRPSAELHPIIVSQDCGHAETAEAIRSYGGRVTHLRQPDLSDVAVKPQHRKFQGYYKISRHYRWALNQVFRRLSHSAVVIVEDDLEVSRGRWRWGRVLAASVYSFVLPCCRWRRTSSSISEPRCRCCSRTRRCGACRPGTTTAGTATWTPGRPSCSTAPTSSPV